MQWSMQCVVATPGRLRHFLQDARPAAFSGADVGQYRDGHLGGLRPHAGYGTTHEGETPKASLE